MGGVERRNPPILHGPWDRIQGLSDEADPGPCCLAFGMTWWRQVAVAAGLFGVLVLFVTLWWSGKHPDHPRFALLPSLVLVIGAMAVGVHFLLWTPRVPDDLFFQRTVYNGGEGLTATSDTPSCMDLGQTVAGSGPPVGSIENVHITENRWEATVGPPSEGGTPVYLVSSKGWLVARPSADCYVLYVGERAPRAGEEPKPKDLARLGLPSGLYSHSRAEDTSHAGTLTRSRGGWGESPVPPKAQRQIAVGRGFRSGQPPASVPILDTEGPPCVSPRGC
jgi:hypothetical protein